MPQEFHALLCVTCKTFQVHIVKKSSNKWECKICKTKQSVLQVYAKGTSAECREVVQQLNFARGKVESERNFALLAQDQASYNIEHESSLCETEFFNEADIAAVGLDNFHANSQQNVTHITEETPHFSTSEALNTQALIKHKSGVLSVPEEKSKWKIFLDSDED